MQDERSNSKGCLIYIFTGTVILAIVVALFNTLEEVRIALNKIPWYFYVPLLIIFWILIASIRSNNNKDSR